MNSSASAPFIRTEKTHWKLGPYHPLLPAPMVVHLSLDGEIISAGRIETGFLARGLERGLERQSWRVAMAYADRLDPEAAAFAELAICLAVEEIARIEVPERARFIRIIVCELSRICSHLLYVVRCARAVGAEAMVQYVLRDRERLIDLFELLAGARFSLNFLRFGGVSADVTEGFIERVFEVSDLVRGRLKEYNDLLTYNRAFIECTRGVAPLRAETVRALGLTGPAARASGLNLDLRVDRPYTGYDRLDLSHARRAAGGPQAAGDAHDRFIVRLREISESLESIHQALERLPGGEFLSRHELASSHRVPRGEAYCGVESARGLLGCHVVSDGSDRPLRVQFRTPTPALVEAFPELIPGHRLDNLGTVLTSLDLSVAEVDK